MDQGLVLRIASAAHDVTTDGPGLRYTVYVQGCPHRCPGCHNPQTHDPDGGTITTVEALCTDIFKNPLLSGVTLSGGEPFLQPEPLEALARACKVRGLTVWVYSGYTFEELQSMPRAQGLLRACDMLVDGPFLEKEKSFDLPFRGSANQRLIPLNLG